MDFWRVLQRICWVIGIAIAVGIVAAWFKPKFIERRELQLRKEQIQEENRKKAELYRSLQSKRERLQEDPRFVERIAREELGYAKPGEVIFKFVDDD